IVSATYKSSVRREHHHGILADHRGQDQPTDKSRAQQASLVEEAGEMSQQDVTPPPMPPRDSAHMRRERETHIWSSFLEGRDGWQPIDSAPADEEVELLIADGRGDPYRIPYPCKWTAASGWVSSAKGTWLPLTPFAWRPFHK